MNLLFSDTDQIFQQEVQDWLSINWFQDLRDRANASAMGTLSKEDHGVAKEALLVRAGPLQIGP